VPRGRWRVPETHEERALMVPDLLNGFHMVAAVTQATINYQFSQLFKQKVIHDTLDITMADTGIALKAKLAAPTVSLSLPDRQRSLLFMLNMPSGKFTYYEGVGPRAKEKSVDFTDWVYAFTVDMDMQHLAQDAVKAGQAIPPIVKQHLSQFTDNMFTIRQLFIDFENADLASYDRTHSRMKFADGTPISPGQMTQFQQAIGNYFTSLKGTNNPYILGYSVDQHGGLPAGKATFSPTGSTFSTFDDPKAEDLNALNFLLMTQGAAFPSDANAGLFRQNWVTQGSYDGKFVIAKSLFVDRWLVPAIKQALGVDLKETTDSGWVFSRHTETKHTEPNSVTCMSKLTMVDGHVTINDNRDSTLTINRAATDKIEIKLTGTFQYTYKNEFTCVLYEWMSETATVNWTATIDISTGNDGQIAAAVTFDLPPATKTTDGNWLGKGDIGLIPDNQITLNNIGSGFEGQMKTIVSNFRDSLSAVWARFILPAGEVFFFKNAQLDAERDLTVDISYKADHSAARVNSVALLRH
jgi:hypothetical protein